MDLYNYLIKVIFDDFDIDQHEISCLIDRENSAIRRWKTKEYPGKKIYKLFHSTLATMIEETINPQTVKKFINKLINEINFYYCYDITYLVNNTTTSESLIYSILDFFYHKRTRCLINSENTCTEKNNYISLKRRLQLLKTHDYHTSNIIVQDYLDFIEVLKETTFYELQIIAHMDLYDIFLKKLWTKSKPEMFEQVSQIISHAQSLSEKHNKVFLMKIYMMQMNFHIIYFMSYDFEKNTSIVTDFYKKALQNINVLSNQRDIIELDLLYVKFLSLASYKLCSTSLIHKAKVILDQNKTYLPILDDSLSLIYLYSVSVVYMSLMVLRQELSYLDKYMASASNLQSHPAFARNVYFQGCLYNDLAHLHQIKGRFTKDLTALDKSLDYYNIKLNTYLKTEVMSYVLWLSGKASCLLEYYKLTHNRKYIDEAYELVNQIIIKNRDSIFEKEFYVNKQRVLFHYNHAIKCKEEMMATINQLFDDYYLLVEDSSNIYLKQKTLFSYLETMSLFIDYQGTSEDIYHKSIKIIEENLILLTGIEHPVQNLFLRYYHIKIKLYCGKPDIIMNITDEFSVLEELASNYNHSLLIDEIIEAKNMYSELKSKLKV